MTELIINNDNKREIIEDLNTQQEIYLIHDLYTYYSRNPIFLSVRRDFNRPAQLTANILNYSNHEENYALKLLPYHDQDDIDDYTREHDILDLFSNPEIIRYENKIDVNLFGRNYILVPMVFYPEVDLLIYLWSHRWLITEQIIRLITYQALKILQILKDHQVVHNDIKFDNFIVKSKNPITIILTDFESAEYIRHTGQSVKFGGTTIYESPEMLRGEPHDYASDIWSLAVNVYYHLYNEYPFGIKENEVYTNPENAMAAHSYMLRKIEENSVWNINNRISENAYNCMCQMLEPDPELRITVEDALNLPWFNGLQNINFGRNANNNNNNNNNFAGEIRV